MNRSSLAAPLVGAAILFAPLMWLGNSDHHLGFAGTLSASPRNYLELLHDLSNNAIHHGFRRIVFVNGHGGNNPIGALVRELVEGLEHA